MQIQSSFPVGSSVTEMQSAPTPCMPDLKSRLTSRVQLTTDGHRAYLSAVEDAFGADIDYAMLNKRYDPEVKGDKRKI